MTRCRHELDEQLCDICTPSPPIPRVVVPYIEPEQDAIAQFVRANARDILDDRRHNDWVRSVGFTALCDAIPRHSRESIVMAVNETMTMLHHPERGQWTHVPGWVQKAWDRTAPA